MAKLQDLMNFESDEMKKFLDSFDTIITDCDGESHSINFFLMENRFSFIYEKKKIFFK